VVGLMPSKPFEEHVKDKHPMKLWDARGAGNSPHFSSAHAIQFNANACDRRPQCCARRQSTICFAAGSCLKRWKAAPQKP